MKKHRFIRIGKYRIGEGCPTFIIAEIGSNHNRDLSLAKKTIKEISKTGADAVKFQTFKAGLLVNKKERPEAYSLLKKNELPWEWHKILKEYAQKNGLIFLSTPFDFEAVDLLKSLKVPAYKIASGDVTNLPLIRKVARFGKPLIISVGAADGRSIREAVNTARSQGNHKIILCQCVIKYPADFSDANVKVLDYLRNEFGVLVGYSDHCRDDHVSMLAICRGAAVIEKHVTLSRLLEGPDHPFSLEISEFKQLVDNIRKAEKILGRGIKYVLPSEQKAFFRARRGIYVNRNLKRGTVLSQQDISILRPAKGLHPKMLDHILGRKLKKDKRGLTPLLAADIL